MSPSTSRRSFLTGASVASLVGTGALVEASESINSADGYELWVELEVRPTHWAEDYADYPALTFEGLESVLRGDGWEVLAVCEDAHNLTRVTVRRHFQTWTDAVARRAPLLQGNDETLGPIVTASIFAAQFAELFR